MNDAAWRTEGIRMKLGKLIPRRKWVRWTLAGLALVLLLGLMLRSTFNYVSICTICGGEENSTEWQLPFTEITYWRTHSVIETPLSKAIARTGISGSHEHAWLFAAGSGNGVMCAIGQGRHLFSAVRSEHAAVFLEAVERYQGPVMSREWRDRLLDPKRSSRATDAIRMSEPPLAGFASHQEFDLWWQQHQEDLVHEAAAEPASQNATPTGI